MCQSFANLSREAYIAVLTLNNVSVSLMERNTVRAAAVVVCDALTVLQSVLNSHDENRAVPPSLIGSFVARAYLHLQNHTQEEPPALVSCYDNDSEGSDSDQSSSEAEEMQMFTVLNERGHNVSVSSQACPRHVLFYLSPDLDDGECSPEMVAALLLHNHGQVYRRLAGIHHADDKKRADVLSEGAKRFFHLSRSVAERIPMPSIVRQALDEEASGCDVLLR